MNKVLIMLSTYNGQKYLREQLDSLYSQEGVDIHIIVRDDGSSDNTHAILEEYRNAYGKLTVLKEKNIGASLSFHRLLAEVSSSYPDYDYYAFCDQDDVWLSDKLITAVSALEKISSKFKLYYCAATLVDAQLKALNRSSGNVINNLPANIVASHSLGCTQVFDQSLMQKAAIIGRKIEQLPDGLYVPLHDGWTALVAYALKATVIYDAKPKILYRQHEHNVIGGGGNSYEKFKSRILRNTTGNKKSRKCETLIKLLRNEIPQDNLKLLDHCADYRNSFKKKMFVLFNKKLYQYGFSTNIGLFFMILFNKF